MATNGNNRLLKHYNYYSWVSNGVYFATGFKLIILRKIELSLPCVSSALEEHVKTLPSPEGGIILISK